MIRTAPSSDPARATLAAGRARLRTAPDARAPRPRAAPAPPWLAAIAAPVFSSIVRRRNARFDRGVGVVSLPVPVVSVGNISVGGVGKSPMVRWIAACLAETGHRPAIAMRGYGAAAGAMTDEQAEHREALLGVPIAAHRSRAAAAIALLDLAPWVDVVILDDGFQHRRLRRDVDIVLIDGTRSPFADRPLPAGWLREPPASLRRAHAVVITHAEAVTTAALDDLAQRIISVAPDASIAIARHGWSRLDTDAGPMEVGALNGRRVHAICGVGNPGALLAQVRATGAVLNSADVMRDHARYSPSAVEASIRRAARVRCEFVLTTGKDWVKLRPIFEGLRRRGVRTPPVVRPRLDMIFDEGEADVLGLVRRAASRPSLQPAPRAGSLRPLLPS